MTTKKSVSKFYGLAYLLLSINLSACNSIPIMVPDMAMRSSQPVQLSNDHGPLSAKQSKAILDKLQKNSGNSNIFDRHLALEAEIVGSPLVVGNSVELLVDGPTTYSAMYEAIKHAKDSINMETYIFENDEVGKRFSELLINKQRSGVQVNLIYDSVGSLGTPKEFFKALKDTGINVLEFNPANPLTSRKGWEVNERDHRKLLVIDGKTAFVGGINISSVYSRGSFSKGISKEKGGNTKGVPWRDTHVRISGPIVNEFQKLFIANWTTQKGEAMASRNYFPKQIPKGNEVVRAIGSSPNEPYSQMYVTLLSAINCAESQVWLTNAYFIPDPQMLAALKEAAQRGVDVRLLLPAKTDSNLVFYASRSYYDELLSSGVKIYERQDALLHAKTGMVDSVWSTIGSTNLDWRSFVSNYEINAVMLGQEFSAKMKALYEKDLGSSKLITLEEWRKRSLLARLKEGSARLWARFL